MESELLEQNELDEIIEESTKDVKVDNLLLINNHHIAFGDIKNFIPTLNEPIVNAFIVPTFYYQKEGNKLIIIIVKSQTQYNLIIVQRIPSLDNSQFFEYDLLYPNKINFEDNFHVVKSWIINPPNETLQTLPDQKKYELSSLSKEYSNKNIDSNFMRSILEINTILPEDLNSIENIINMLKIKDIQNIRSISPIYNNKINLVILDVVKRKYPNELTNVSDESLKNIDFLSLYQRIKENEEISLIDWAAGHDMSLLNILLDKGLKPTIQGANLAAGEGNMELLEYLSSMNPPIFPNIDGATLAAQNDHLNTLDWLYGDRPSIKDLAEKYGNLTTLGWVDRNMSGDLGLINNSRQMSSGKIIYLIVRKFHQDFIQEIERIKNRGENPTSLGYPDIEWFILNGLWTQINEDEAYYIMYYINQEKEAIGPSILPSSKALGDVIENNYTDVLNWLENKIDSENGKLFIDFALNRGNIDILNRYFNRNPDYFLNYIIEKRLRIYKAIMSGGHIKSIQWLDELIDRYPSYFRGSRMQYTQREMGESIHYGHLNLVKILISRGINIDNSAGHIAIKYNRFNILDYFLTNNLVDPINMANYACHILNLNVLKWLESRGILPDNIGANNVVVYEDDKKDKIIEEWLKERGIYPDDRITETIILADEGKYRIYPEERRLEMLQRYEAERGFTPTRRAADVAIIKKYNNILRWIMNKDILPTEKGANWAARHKQYDLLDLLYNNYNILPTSEVLDSQYVRVNRDVNMIQWLTDKGILPTSKAADFLAERENYAELNVLAGQGILPSSKSYDLALINNKQRLIEWLNNKGIISPSSEVADFAIYNNNIEFLNRLLKGGIYPTKNGVITAYFNKNIPILDLLSQKGIFPPQETINLNPIKDVKLVSWLLSKNLLPENEQNIKLINEVREIELQSRSPPPFPPGVFQQ